MTSAGHHSMMEPASSGYVGVSWLQSDGTAYVDFPDVLGLKGRAASSDLPDFKASFGIYSIAKPSSSTSGSAAVCAMGQARPRCIQILSSTNVNWASLQWLANYTIGISTYPTVTSIGFGTAVSASTGNRTGTIFVNGDLVAEARGAYANSPMAPLRMFATGSVDGSGNYTSVTLLNAHAKVTTINIASGSTTVLDAVPVRLGTVAGWLDRLTGVFYGNSAASGTLVYGPDRNWEAS